MVSAVKWAGMLLVGAGLFTAGLLVGWQGARAEAPVTAAADQSGDGRNALRGPGATRVDARPGAARQVRHPFPALPRSREGLTGVVEVFGGDSIEEARWLDRHGFPNALQWERYTLAADLQLEQAALAGDTVARSMLDARRLRTDPQAEARLLLAGAEGDLFALNQLAAFKAHRSDGAGEAYAISRAAEMRGDLTLALTRPIMLGGRLPEAQRLLAEAEALALNRHLNQLYRQKHGMDPPPVEQRPYQMDED